jgi:hypothetical protein
VCKRSQPPREVEDALSSCALSGDITQTMLNAVSILTSFTLKTRLSVLFIVCVTLLFSKIGRHRIVSVQFS